MLPPLITGRKACFGCWLAGCVATHSAAAAPREPLAPEPAATQRPPAPAASPRGWAAASLGLARVDAETRVGSASETTASEGAASGGFTQTLSYEKLLLPFLGLRLLGHRATWSTQLSDASGDGDRVVYDLGAAPVLSWSLRDGLRGASLDLFVPISFSLSNAPARGPREIVREEMDLGRGYRVGLGLSMLFRMSEDLGLYCEAEVAQQRLMHERSYRLLDGSGPTTRLAIDYKLTWVSASLGLAFMP